MLVMVTVLLCAVSCVSEDDHTHSYTNGQCSCGAKDPSYHKHTPSEAVKENEEEATCTAGGSYDEVVYCAECRAVISRTKRTTEKLPHKFVDNKCSECNLTDPGYEPDYGNATVYTPGTEVVLITDDFTEELIKMTATLDGMLKWDGKGGVVNGSIYYPNSKHEILFNVRDEDESRPFIARARQLLERIEKDSYFEARYVIYSESGTIAVAFDDNEYTNLQATDYVIEKLRGYLTSKDNYVALPQGIIEAGTINLKAIQEEIDLEYSLNQWSEFEKAAKEKYGAITGKRIVDSFRTYYSMIDDRVVSWFITSRAFKIPRTVISTTLSLEFGHYYIPTWT